MLEILDFPLNQDEICEKIFRNKEIWVDRKIFNTFGAASYLDNKDNYIINKEKSNPILIKEFKEIYNRLCNLFGAELNKEIAYPGFHIFDCRAATLQGSIHFDEPYKRLPIYKETFSNPQSFTAIIKKPKLGAGLNIWDNIDLSKLSKEQIKSYTTGERNIGNPKYIEYELNKIYIHSGHVLHQIANRRFTSEYDYRISLQGHVIKDGDKKYLYF